MKRGKKSWTFSAKGRENGRDAKRIRQPEALTVRASTALQGAETGIDGGKKVKGRKRHIPADTPGFILSAAVTPANEGGRNGLKRLSEDYFSKGIDRLRKIWVDGGYSGSSV